jgi:glycosyltransferase involved in cell wall biosynthesis
MLTKVSIGMPVYNGEKYISSAISSILAQSFENYEIVICDNASIDKTKEICQAYSQKDSRIKYFRNRNNMGAAYNFNKAFNLSTGKYFKWAAVDDLLHPFFLERCIDILDKDQSIVLCHSKTYRIDENAKIIGSYTAPIRYDSNEIAIRFSDLILKPHSCVMIFGVIRSEILKRTKIIGSYFGSDRNLLAELSLYGKLYEIPEYLFFRRDHADASVRKYSVRERVAWFDTTRKNKIVLPIWRNLFEYFLAPIRSNIDYLQRLKCFIILIKWINHNWRWMASDIKYAVKQLLT